MENSAGWRTESRMVYFKDFKIRIVELVSQPGANIAKIARENGVALNLIFISGCACGNMKGRCYVACLLQPYVSSKKVLVLSRFSTYHSFSRLIIYVVQACFFE